MTRRGRIWRFVRPCIAVAAAGAIAAGLVEGVEHGGGVLRIAATAGFSALWSTPIAAAALVLVRLLWIGWRPRALFDATAQDGGSPTIAAWLLYVIAAIALLAPTLLVVLERATILFNEARVIGLAGALAITIAVCVLAIASRPIVGLLASLLRRVDRKLRRERSLFTPPRMIAGACVVLGGAGVLVWYLVVAPRIGNFRVEASPYIMGFAAGTAIGGALWARLDERGRRRIAAGAGAAWLLVIASAAYTRWRAPFTVLEIWGEAPVAGHAIAAMFDLERVHGDFDLATVRPPARPGAPHHDVVLVTIDTVRADRTPPYGGPAEMPGIAALATRAAVFEHAYASGNTTRRSLPTLATGLSPHRVRGRPVSWALRLDPRHVAIAERFAAAGYDTTGIFCCEGQFSRSLGLSRGIDHLAFVRHGAQLVPQTIAWLEERARRAPARPLFLWIHLYEPHEWDQRYPPGQYGNPIAPRYDRLLGDTDATLKPLLEYLAVPDRAARTILVVTSDHGEALGDHGTPAHSTDLYNTQIHVPLLIAAPEIAPRRIPRVVGLVDLAPTLLDLAGFEPPGMPSMDGVSLAPLARGERASTQDEGSVYASMIPDHQTAFAMDAIVVGRKKLIAGPGGRVQVFDLATDPNELHDLSYSRIDLREELRSALMVRRAVDKISPF